MKICCQIPVNLPYEDPQTRGYYDQLQKHFARVKRPDTEVIIKDVGRTSMGVLLGKLCRSTHFQLRRNIEKYAQGRKEGCDGVSISCLDPMLSEARQLLKIPVVSLSEASMHLAFLMGSKFAIITKEEHFVPAMEAQIFRYVSGSQGHQTQSGKIADYAQGTVIQNRAGCFQRDFPGPFSSGEQFQRSRQRLHRRWRGSAGSWVAGFSPRYWHARPA